MLRRNVEVCPDALCKVCYDARTMQYLNFFCVCALALTLTACPGTAPSDASTDAPDDVAMAPDATMLGADVMAEASIVDAVSENALPDAAVPETSTDSSSPEAGTALDAQRDVAADSVAADSVADSVNGG